MSVKYFCDQCGEEITPKNRVGAGGRLVVHDEEGETKTRMRVEVVTSLGGVANAGTFCKYCVIDLVASADDRARCEPSLEHRLLHRLPLLVDRFLAWPVPPGACADPCACDPGSTCPPRLGTNFLDATSARKMLAYVLELEL